MPGDDPQWARPVTGLSGSGTGDVPSTGRASSGPSGLIRRHQGSARCLCTSPQVGEVIGTQPVPAAHRASPAGAPMTLGTPVTSCATAAESASGR